jgi:hypothetical protein
MHRFSNSGELSGAGHGLSAQTAEGALAEAEALRTDGRYMSAFGYIVVDTEDGAVLHRQERGQSSIDLKKASAPGARPTRGRQLS